MKPSLAPSAKQCLILEFIDDYMQDNQGRAPILEDIASALNMPRSTVAYHIGQLRAKGFIEQAGGGKWRNAVPSIDGLDYLKRWTGETSSVP